MRLPPPNASFAYVTLIFGGTVHLKAALCLQDSLRRSASVVPFIVVHDNETLVRPFAYSAHVNELAARTRPDGRRLYQWARYKDVMRHKFLAWTFTEYDRIVVLDADTYVLRNIDHLFRLPMLHRVAAAPACSNSTFNGGVLVVRPSIADAVELLHASASRAVCEMRKTDQSMLNEVYARRGWHRLSNAYNFARHSHALRSWMTLPVNVVHVVGEPKIDFCHH